MDAASSVYRLPLREPARGGGLPAQHRGAPGHASEFLDLLGVAGAAGIWARRHRGPVVTPLTLGTVPTQEVTSSLPDTSAEAGSLHLSSSETLMSFEILTGEELGPGFRL